MAQVCANCGYGVTGRSHFLTGQALVGNGAAVPSPVSHPAAAPFDIKRAQFYPARTDPQAQADIFAAMSASLLL